MLKFEAALKIAGTSDPIIKRVHEHTRVFFPTDANDDGTYTYVYLLDPNIEDEIFDIQSVLRKSMPQAEAGRLEQLIDECHADQKFIGLVEVGR
jgi:hypothetical protein